MSAHSGSTSPPNDGWPHEVSPFHAGERAMQARSGMRDRLEVVGRRMMRPFMPEQHRELFEKLPLVFVGRLDPQGRVWATMLTGPLGFVHSPNPETLSIDHALEPPLDSLASGERLGVLGIELSTRRRNRVNGVVQATTPGGFSMRVEQSFGNCPQYIQARRHDACEATGRPAPTEVGPVLSGRGAELVGAADTFFIATTSGTSAEAPNEGLDVSHRGGLPGFVKVRESDGATYLAWPEYRGNYMFCTLGNLERDPRAGLLFVDFSSGTTLRLTGRAAVIDDESLAQDNDPHHTTRSVLFRVESGVLTEHALPYRFSEPDMARELR
jgi:predicted pyridoxine 5'-phosphate oxidase superfamily flavin-nucleotide-binding protein